MTLTIDQPLTDLQLKVLGVIQEFKGLGGIAAFRLAKESGTKAEYVDECLRYFKDLKLVQEKRGYPSSFWTVTEQGEQVLNGHTPEIAETVPEPFPSEASAPSDASVLEIEAEAEEEYEISPVESAAPDEPDVWYICDHVDEKGKKCGRRFTSQHGLMTHESMVHKPENAKVPGTPARDVWQKYRCNVEGCGFTTGNLQGLKHHKTSKHGERVAKAKSDPPGKFPCTECEKVFDTAQGLLTHRQRVHLKTLISPGRRTVGSEASIDDRIKHLYPDHTVRQIVREVGLTDTKVEKRIYRLIKSGQLQYKRPRVPSPSVATKEEMISKDSPPWQVPPTSKTKFASSTKFIVGGDAILQDVRTSPDPLAGLGTLISQLQAIPGVKVNVTIGISLGVNQ